MGLTLAPLETTPEPAPIFDPDLLIDIEPYARSDDDLAIDGVLDKLGVLDAYNRWTGKGTVDAGGRRESIMIRCPRPDHEDKTPSAWANTDTQVWHCGACNEGGDKFDIAAWRFGFPVPGYKSGKTFPELRRKMAEDLGYIVRRTPSGTEYVEKLAPEMVPDIPSRSDVCVDEDSLAPIITMPGPHTDEVEDTSGYIDWRSLVPYNTFLREWMQVTTAMDVPDEYLFWNGIAATNFAAGNDVVMPDRNPVKSNIFTCLFGSSGSGKSLSLVPLTELLRQALPYDRDDPDSSGTMVDSTPSSAEALIDSFSKELLDPADPKKRLGYVSVRGLVQYNELSDLLGKSGRMGSVLKPTLMAFYDAHGNVTMRSRGAGYVHAERPFCQAITTTQVRSAADLLRDADADSGFLNRWVFVTCTAKPRVSMSSPLDVSSLVKPLRTVRAWASRGRTIKFDAAGSKRFDEWFHGEYLPRVTGEHEEILLQRCDLLMKKLIVSFCTNRMTDVATEEIVGEALSLWRYLQSGYGVLRRRLGVVETHEVGEAVIKALREFHAIGVMPTVRDLHSRKLKTRFKDKDIIIRALTQMKILGEIEELITQHPKNKTVVTRYRLVEDD